MEFVFRLDLDYIDKKTLEKYIDMIKKIGKARIKKIRYRVSAGGEGYHVEITYQVPDPLVKMMSDANMFLLGVRFSLLDCYGRIKGDIARHKNGERIDRLADYKYNRTTQYEGYAGNWHTCFVAPKKKKYKKE